MVGILLPIDNLNILKEKNLFRKLKITLDIDSILIHHDRLDTRILGKHDHLIVPVLRPIKFPPHLRQLQQ